MLFSFYYCNISSAQVPVPFNPNIKMFFAASMVLSVLLLGGLGSKSILVRFRFLSFPYSCLIYWMLLACVAGTLRFRGLSQEHSKEVLDLPTAKPAKVTTPDRAVANRISSACRIADKCTQDWLYAALHSYSSRMTHLLTVQTTDITFTGPVTLLCL